MSFDYQYPSVFNAYIPAATGQVIAYVRDPKSYKINSYAQLVPAKKSVFIWYEFHPDDMGQRVPSTVEPVWADGAERPRNPQNTFRFRPVEGQTVRYNYDFQIGWQALEQADLPILVMHTVMARNQLMTGRTQRTMTILETAANWGSNTDTVNSLNGGAGFWDQSSADPASGHYLAIKKSLDAAAIRIQLATNNAVNWNEEAPNLILNPDDARRISESDEIHNYLRESPYALDQVRGRTPGQNSVYGLPDMIYGWRIVVEDASIVTERPQVSGSQAATTGSPAPRRFVKSSGSAVGTSRVGGIDGQTGAPSFSTLQIYYNGTEAALETMDFPWDKLTRGSCFEDVKSVLAAPASGFLFQNTMSS